MAFDWRVTGNLLLTANYEAVDNDLPRLQPFFALAPGVAVPPAPDASRNISMSWDNFQVRSRNTHLKAEWAFTPDWILTAQALHSTNKRTPVKNARFGFILDNGGNTMLFGDQGAYDTTDTSEQLRVNGKLNAIGLRHEIAVGVNSFREKTRLSDNAALGVFMTNLYAPVDSPEPANATFVTGVSQRLEASSIFASDIISFNERWSVLLGARRAKLSIENFNVTTGAVTGGSSIEKTTPTTSLMYKPSRNSLLYMTYAEGLEQGGTAPLGTANANQRLGPMVTEQLELGGKINFSDLALTAAAFDMKKPLEIVDPTTNLYTQNGQQRHRGLEFTGTGKLTSNLTLVAGTMLLDPTATGTGVPANEGKKPVGVPRSTANVWGVYRISEMQGLSLNAGVFHSSAQYADATNTLEVPAWTRFDAGLRYDTRAGAKKVSFLLSIENLTDRSYWTGAQSGLLVLSNPRTVKLAAKIDL